LLRKGANKTQPAKPLLGEVFTACVFGHYLLIHRLLPLLSRPSSSRLTPARIIWSSSIEAVSDVFTLNDIQSLKPNTTPYESSKRLTDLLALTATLPSVKPISDVYLSSRDFDDEDEDDREGMVAPKIYLTHPGVVASTLFPLPWFLFWAYELALTLARYLGSPWHAVHPRPGAASTVYIALQPQDALDAQRAERKKWGSAVNSKGDEFVRTTEVEGWGFSGEVEDVTDESVEEAVLRRSVGRKKGARDVTERDVAEFEEVGREVWEAMEEMREEWEEMLDL
jgi:3-keto steroid reductase